METTKLTDVNNIDVKISGLKILKKIGEGGMSVVYLAEQLSLRRKVAVKVMRLEIADNDLDVQRFKHEAKTIAHLDHPNIINIYNIGQTAKGEVYFTMPYLNHGNLSNYLLENEQEFITLLKSICDGLSFAHINGVVHRDIKPENLLFDKFGNIQIADFGIAISKEGSRMTKEHQIVGSAQYMSPEQARSNDVGLQTDIYSLGIVIYERLTGNVPFNVGDSITILVNHVSTEPPKLNSKIRHWQNLIDKCLAKSPTDRFQSMQELKKALDKIPINSIQRTNDTIQNILKTNHGKHLKWFVPSLIILLIIAMAGIKQEPKIISPISKHPAIIQNTVNTQEIPIAAQKSKLVITEKATDITSTEILAQDENTQALLTRAYENIKNYRLSKPADDNATDQLLQILANDPTHVAAIKGLENIGGGYFQLVKSALFKFDVNTALKHSIALQKFNQKTQFINTNYPQEKQSLLKIASKLDMSPINISAKKVQALAQMVEIYDPNSEFLTQLTSMAEVKATSQIGKKLADKLGIETILVRNNLTVSINEITVDQYTQFAQATKRNTSKCKHIGAGIGGFFKKPTWKKPSFKQTGNQPVVCVSHNDAHAYSQWLSTQSGNKYRLPSKQEWLQLAATNNNNFIACKTANLTGQEAKKIRNKEDKYSCNDNFNFTAPVATFTKNNLGINDIHGNVSEWIACQQPCTAPTAMGSSWYHGKQSNKADKETTFKENSAFTNIGFRLVRDL
ncbi:MAG: bifunctional serine/threonine-protein kinase/formylglycine-generating enzyme family protein [Proteobacteria bacterium]|nr:bifunctional serine/threonine-protein kinase/formylglycine-generating enzyme family protein [Pseudomonadota bacterium]